PGCSLFWAWLAGHLLEDAARAIGLHEPARRRDPAGYQAIVRDGLTKCESDGWVMALCGHKPFARKPYFARFYRFAERFHSDANRVRVCRLFIEPLTTKGFPKEIAETINDHMAHRPSVLPLLIRKAQRRALHEDLAGIAESLDNGFGFLV